jgi:hypothetical protein
LYGGGKEITTQAVSRASYAGMRRQIKHNACCAIMTQYWRLWAAHHMRVWGGYENTTQKVCEDKRKTNEKKVTVLETVGRAPHWGGNANTTHVMKTKLS